jgi:uncharacterized protein
LPGYFYSASEGAVWVHLYGESVATVALDGERTIKLRQRTRYPWDGSVEINVEAEGEFALMLRIPAWCEEDAAVEVNSEPVDAARFAAPGAGWQDRLYRTMQPCERKTRTHPTGVTAVPYHAWANREPGTMRVWLRHG